VARLPAFRLTNKRRFAAFLTTAAAAAAAAAVIAASLSSPSVNGDEVSLFADGRVSLVVGGSLIASEKDPIVIGDGIYVELGAFIGNIHAHAYYEEAYATVSVTTRDSLIRMGVGEAEVKVNLNPVRAAPPAMESGGDLYVSLTFLSEYLGLEVAFLEGNGVVAVDLAGRKGTAAKAAFSTVAMRAGAGFRHPIVHRAADSGGYDLAVYG